MGSCWNCETQLTLEEKGAKCDSCGEIVRYWCNNCKEPFDVLNKETLEKLKECKACGYFYCPKCNVCSGGCPKGEWIKKIKEIFNMDYWKIHTDKWKELLDFIEDIKLGKERRTCQKGVPISYAKNRVKSLLCRLEGYRVRNEEDKRRFGERMDKILNLPIGEIIIINKVREDGTYGQEYRDAFNLSICLGKLKVTWRENKEGKKYALFERTDTETCHNLIKKDLLITECENKECSTKVFPKGTEHCNICYYKKGEKKGQPYKTKTRVSNKDACQLYRGDFKKKVKDEQNP